jgi:hypothetical protein
MNSTLKRNPVSRLACAEGGCAPHRIRVWYKGQQLVSIKLQIVSIGWHMDLRIFYTVHRIL